MTVFRTGGSLLIAGAIALVVLAFVLPEGGEPAGIDPLTARMIRAEARHASDFPPRALDIEDAEVHIADFQPIKSATIRWRMIFNVPFGITHIDEQQTDNQIDVARWIGVWSGFLLTELALLIGGGWMLTRY